MQTYDNSKPSFHNLGISQSFLNYLDKVKFTVPTPIQHKAIPIALEGKDIVGVAQTGTGKTLAFGIPMVQLLSIQKGTGLILVPTRELALQVDETLHALGHTANLKTVVLIGGASLGNQIKELKRRPRIIIATPGRLNDHITRQSVLLFDVKLLVLDEADRMLDMGFAPQINEILKVIPKQRQTMLFSATMPPEIIKIATKYMKLPISVEVARQGKTAENISQEIFIIKKENKKTLLRKLLNQYPGTVLIFTRTKIGAKILARQLNTRGNPQAAEIHSDRSLSQRQAALAGFKSGKYRILVATDIAARGIDVTNIELVINYDLPDEAESYVHRIGRTARAGKKGHAISFATPDQGKNIKQIERLIKIEIQVSSHPDIISEMFDDTLPPANKRPNKRPAGKFKRKFPPKANGRIKFSQHKRRKPYKIKEDS